MLDRLRQRALPTLGEHVPIEDVLTERTLRLADGGALAMLEVAGWNAEAADVAAIREHFERWAATLYNVAASDRLVLAVYACRGLAGPDAVPPADPRLPAFAARLREDYAAALAAGRLYENRLLLAVHLRPPLRGDEWAAGRRPARDERERAGDRAARLDDICGWFASELGGPAAARPLGLAVRGRQVFSEIAEAVAYAATGVARPVALTTGRLGDALFCEEVAFHHETVEIRGPAHTAVAAVLAHRQYPAVTWPGMFDALLAAPLRFTWQQSFEPLPPSGGLKLLTRKQNKMIWADDKARSQLAALDAAADHVAGGGMSMGRHSSALAIFADRAGMGRSAARRLLAALNRRLEAAGLAGVASAVAHDVVDGVVGPASQDPLTDAVNEAWRRLSAVGPTPVRVTRTLMAGWTSLIPGNTRFLARPGACSNRNFAAMAPLHGFARGAERSRWGAPIAVLRNSAGEPYRFHWHDGEGADAVGNTLVTGETGSGKTVAVGFLTAHTAGRANVVALDHKRGWDPLVRHLGGAYAVLGQGLPMFAPLKAMRPEDAGFLVDLLRGCIVQGGWRDLTPEEDRLLALGVEAVMGNPPAERRLAEVAAFLSPDVDPEGAGARLRRWCRGEELGWALDAPRCALDLAHGVVGLDTTALLANRRAAAPALLYLFRRISDRLDGRTPLLLTVDEGWKTMEDAAFFGQIAAQLRTIRSKDGVVVFVTQSPSDLALAPHAAATLLEQCPNQIHFPNPRATEEDYVEGLKRTRGEFEALHALRKGSGRFLLCKGGEGAVVELPLRGLDRHLAVLSASEAALRRLDALPAAVRDDPARIAEAFAAPAPGPAGRAEVTA